MIQPAFLLSKNSHHRKRIFIGAAIIIIIFLALSLHYHHQTWKLALTNVKKKLWLSGALQFEKPEGLKVIAFVFFGRIDRTSILDCYLRRNLVHNGGWLDEVVWVVNQHDDARLAWLDSIVSSTPGYSTWQRCIDCGFEKAWQIVEDGPMYIKIDDDIVFIEDGAIPSIVSTLYNNPEYLAVTANIVNQPRMSWIHARYGAIHPYLPEQSPPAGGANTTSWRASDLPEWDGPQEYDFTEKFAAPFEGHRWLPLPPGSNPYKTPIATSTYDAAGPGWHFWAVAAHEHASFFHNLERGELWRYDHGPWVFWAEQFSIQFVAVWGKTMLEHPLTSEDEKDLTIYLPKQLGRHCVMAGRGVVVHYAHGAQYGSGVSGGGHGIEWTNFLEMYRSYAQENVC